MHLYPPTGSKGNHFVQFEQVPTFTEFEVLTTVMLTLDRSMYLIGPEFLLIMASALRIGPLRDDEDNATQ